MMEFSNTLRTVFLTFILFVFTSMLSAQDGGAPRTPSAKAQALAQKRAQFEQDAAVAIPEVETEFIKFISWINTGQIPDDANVNASLKFVARTRKFLPVFNKQRKAGTYNALSAWVYYFDNKPDKVQKLVAAAIKDTGQNMNALKTNLALSLIYKDYESVSQIIASAPAAAASENQEPSSQSSENTLNLDVNSIRSNLLGKIFNIRPASPDKDILCLLLWKLDPNELDRFAPQEPKPAEITDPNIPVQETLPSGDSGINEVKPTPGVNEFSKLRNQFVDNKKAVFMGINFNDPSKTKNIEKWMAENPQSWQAAVPSAALQQKTISFLGIKLDKPLLLITGPDSTIRYVGDANCFLPNLIIRNILANAQEFIEPNDPNKLNMSNEPNTNTPALQQAPVVIAEPIKTSTPPAGPNVSPQQTPAVKEAPQTPQQTQVQSPPPAPAVIDNDFFDPQAETLIEHARALFKIGNRLQYHTYANPIEMCRRVIKDYPNTKYSEQARILMRNVPERYRERYQITNEELGL